MGTKPLIIFVFLDGKKKETLRAFRFHWSGTHSVIKVTVSQYKNISCITFIHIIDVLCFIVSISLIKTDTKSRSVNDKVLKIFKAINVRIF